MAVYPEYDIIRSNAFNGSWMQGMMLQKLQALLQSHHAQEGYHPNDNIMATIRNWPMEDMPKLFEVMADMFTDDNSAPSPYSTQVPQFLEPTQTGATNGIDYLLSKWGDPVLIKSDDGEIFHPHFIVGAFQLRVVDDIYNLLSSSSSVHKGSSKVYLQTLANAIGLFCMEERPELNSSHDGKFNRQLHNFIPAFIAIAYSSLQNEYRWSKVDSFYELDMLAVGWGGGNAFHRTAVMEAIRHPDRYLTAQYERYVEDWVKKGKPDESKFSVTTPRIK